MADYRTETINAVKSMGITARELGFVDQTTYYDMRNEWSKRYNSLINAVADLISRLDATDTAREIFEEDLWEDLGIADHKYKIVEVQLVKKVYKTINVVMDNEEYSSSADDYIDFDDIEIDSDCDEDDWESTEFNTLKSDLTKADAEEYCGRYDVVNDIDEIEF